MSSNRQQFGPDARRIWVTRTQPQAEATADHLRQRGWIPVVAPLLATRPLDPTDAATLDGDGVDALAFTSQAAVRAYAALRPGRDLRVFVVGAATGRAAREAGFTQISEPDTGAAGDVAALAGAIAAARPRPTLVLNPTAREPAADLQALLTQGGVAARAVVVYETVEAGLDRPPEDLVGLLIHSPKAATAAARVLSPAAAETLAAFAISEAAAAPLRSLRFRALSIAERPEERALLDLLPR